MHRLYHPAVPLLGVHLNEIHTVCSSKATDKSAHSSIVCKTATVLCITAPNAHQHQDGTRLCTHTVGYSAVMRMKGLQPRSVRPWMARKHSEDQPHICSVYDSSQPGSLLSGHRAWERGALQGREMQGLMGAQRGC